MHESSIHSCQLHYASAFELDAGGYANPAMTSEHTPKTSSSTHVHETLYGLIGLTMNSDPLHTGLKAVFGILPESELKVYSDCVYLNYYTVGTSLLFAPDSGYRPKAASLDGDKLQLKSIDIYNNQAEESGKRDSFKAFPLLPLLISTLNEIVLTITDSTTGKQIVEVFGEPARKGGGGGSSSGSIDIWCEWPGLMVEFGQRGPQAWERGKDAPWKVITIFCRTETGH